MKKYLPWIITIVVLGLFFGLFCRVTVVPDKKAEMTVNDKGEEVAVAEMTPAEKYCAENWDSKMLPVLTSETTPIETVLELAKTDLNAAGAKYGVRDNESSAWNFRVSGTNKVVDIFSPDKATHTALMMDAQPYDGTADFEIQVSKILKTNTLRDSVGFLKLDDFENQVDFANLTKAFNARIQKDVISKVTAADLKGKEIKWVGPFSPDATLSKIGSAEDVLVIPVAVPEVVGE